MKALIVFEKIPEDSYFLVVEGDEALMEKLKTFHKQYIENYQYDEINDFFYNIETGELKHTKLEVAQSGHFDLVIITGIIL